MDFARDANVAIKAESQNARYQTLSHLVEDEPVLSRLLLQAPYVAEAAVLVSWTLNNLTKTRCKLFKL